MAREGFGFDESAFDAALEEKEVCGQATDVFGDVGARSGVDLGNFRQIGSHFVVGKNIIVFETRVYRPLGVLFLENLAQLASGE